MSKEANTHYPVHELIRKRWSPRSFTDQPISHPLLMQLFEAASWSFSASNTQPWNYVYAHREDTEAFDKLFDCLTGGNRAWANKAAVIIMAVAKTKTDDGKPLHWAYHDLGAANMCLMLEATANGIVGHPMAGFDAAKAKADFNLPDGYEPLVFMALGYLNSPDALVEPFKTRETNPRTRKPINDFVFQNEWNQTIPTI